MQFCNFLTYILSVVSSVPAQKLKCPSSARLGNFIARARLSRKNPAQTHHYYLEIPTYPCLWFRGCWYSFERSKKIFKYKYRKKNILLLDVNVNLAILYQISAQIIWDIFLISSLICSTQVQWIMNQIIRSYLVLITT